MEKAPLGTIGVGKATLLDANKEVIGYCLDTPNAIANAIKECPKAYIVISILGNNYYHYYNNRINKWNTAPSYMTLV